MSEFLVIVPPPYVEFPNATHFINNWVGEDAIHAIIANRAWWELSSFLDSAGLLPAGMGIHAAQFFKTLDAVEPLKLWVIWGPEL